MVFEESVYCEKLARTIYILLDYILLDVVRSGVKGDKTLRTFLRISSIRLSRY